MNEAAFKVILQTHAGLLSRIASSYEFRVAQRQDLLQNIAIALWKALPGWRGEASIKTFAARIAHNQGVKHVIAQRHDPVGGELDPEWVDERADPHGDAEQQQQREQLLKAVQSLPLATRQVVMLSLEGFGPTEIAAVLGVSPNVAMVRLSRGRQSLRQMMRPLP